MGTTNYNEQSPVYHGIQNAKYCMRGEGGAAANIKPMPYVKSASFDPQIETLPIYASNVKVLAVVSDKGYTGNLGVTAQDRGFEKDLGQIIDIESGQADVNLINLKRCDVYYEYIEHTAAGTPYVVKVWVLNVETAKASKTHNTDEDSIKIGEYQYPITVYGDKIKASTGETVYKDANGNELTATRIISLPGDAGYADFDKTVPVAKMKAAAEG